MVVFISQQKAIGPFCYQTSLHRSTLLRQLVDKMSFSFYIYIYIYESCQLTSLIPSPLTLLSKPPTNQVFAYSDLFWFRNCFPFTPLPVFLFGPSPPPHTTTDNQSCVTQSYPIGGCSVKLLGLLLKMTRSLKRL